jgi:imidazolonepropionase-like amidohydrolase
VAWLGPGRLVRDAAVVASGGAVVYAGSLWGAPPADEELQLDGFLLPGYADRHVHIGLSDPVQVLHGGVTAVRDLAWPAEDIFPLAEASELPSFRGPLIRAAGPMLTAPGGYPQAQSWAPPGTALIVRGADDATGAVSKLAERGATAIKVSLNAEAGPTVSDAELGAICSAAGERDIPVTVHAQGAGQVERALGAGVAEFAHCPWTHELSDAVIGQMASTTRVVSTLDMLSYGRDTPELRRALDNLRRFVAAGGRVSYGTDLGNGAIPPGIDLREVVLLRDAGLEMEAILAALARGSLDPGAPADLVGLRRDPFEEIDALGDLLLVVREGRVVVPA